ncbi:uncharacterized protein LOC131319925 isoform X1 [Rhododendron vialii]|uniref:uncharacterized protein LOC131319925 isoform X1 n=1 Tax=Rhododendron vialii TaxID=182163 RepID=UPI00265FCC90|nr:uncharacterized protein LOC131319925 isoform X1 [Rhododendron vialii]
MYFNSFNLTKRRLLGLPLLKKFELFPIAACAACFSTFSFSLCSLPLFNVSTLTKMVKPFQMYDLYKMKKFWLCVLCLGGSHFSQVLSIRLEEEIQKEAEGTEDEGTYVSSR